MVKIGGGSSSSTTKPTRVDVWSPEQWQIARGLFPIIQQGMQQPAPAYPGQMYVPTTPQEQAFFGMTSGLDEASRTALQQLLTRTPAYTITPETTEQFYQSAVRAPALYEFQHTTLPQIRESFVGPGYYGSARAQAEANAAERLAMGLAAQRANLAYADELARRQAAQTAANLQAATANLGVTTMGTAGALARQIEQERVMADLARWLAGEQVEGAIPWQYNPFLQLAFQYLGLTPYAIGQTGTSRSWDIGFKVG